MYSITFSKVIAGQGTELEGAELTVSGTALDGTTVDETWTSTGTAHTLELKAGVYVLTEDAAPLGYEISSAITFRVNLDGSVDILVGDDEDGEWLSVNDATVTMIDELTEQRVSFSKVEAGQGTELAGASLRVEGTGYDNSTVDIDWISDGTTHELMLVAGVYTLTEDAAPLGYDIASDITFRVNLDGTVDVYVDEAWVPADEATVIMVDELTERDVTFSKVAAGQGKELAGAKITVKDAAGNVIESWTSSGSAKVLKLVAGEYTMIEDAAPLGYKLASAIIFRVNLDGTVEVKVDNTWVAAANAKVVMVNELIETDVPKTGETASTLPYVGLGLLLSAGVLFFIRRKKAHGDA